MSEVSVEELVGELMECSDSDLDDRVRALELERRRVEAELALTAGEIDRRRSQDNAGPRCGGHNHESKRSRRRGSRIPGRRPPRSARRGRGYDRRPWLT